MKKMAVPYKAPQNSAAVLAYCNETHLPLAAAIPALIRSEATRLDHTRLGETL